MAYDLVVKDALIVDGTGKNVYAGDVAVENGTIAAVGKVDGGGGPHDPGRRTGRGAGVHRRHTHYDAQLLWDPQRTPRRRTA